VFSVVFHQPGTPGDVDTYLIDQPISRGNRAFTIFHPIPCGLHGYHTSSLSISELISSATPAAEAVSMIAPRFSL
jgi:hypothetical protein